MTTEIENIYDEYIHLGIELRGLLVKRLHELLKNNGGEIDFRDEKYKEAFEMYSDDGYTTVSYDGGNHPEYDSNLYSELYGAFIKERGNEKEIFLDIEDCECYSICRVPIYDLYCVVEAVEFFANYNISEFNN